MSSSLPEGTTCPRALGKDIHWPFVPARDLFELQYGRALVQSSRRPGPVPVYGTNGRCGSHDEALFAGPGVILGRKGQGPLGVEWCDEPFWVIDTAYSLVPRRPDIDLKFSYYLIKHIGLNHLKDGTSNPSLRRDTFGAQALPLPPLQEQKRIAGILSALDDKIEANRRMSCTLELIARAIFKSWFVDFDPVRKKMDGKSGHELGLPGSLVDQFPASLCQTSKGLTPEGWEHVRLGAVAEFAKGCSYKSADLRTSRTALVTLGSFARGGGYRVDGLKDYVGEYKPTQVVEPGDVVVAHTDVTQAAEVLGRAVRVGASSSHETLVASLDAVIVRPDSRRLTKEFLFLALDNERFREHAYGYSNGTTVLHLSARALPEYTILLPPLGLVEAFSGVVEKLFARSASSADESPVLERARDSLLPRLLRDLA